MSIQIEAKNLDDHGAEAAGSLPLQPQTAQDVPWRIVAKGSLFNVPFYVVNYGALFLNQLTLARYLGGDKYGKYSFVFAYLYFFNIIAEMGVEKILLRELSQRKNEGSLLGACFLLRMLLSVIAVLASVLILHTFYPPSGAYTITLLAALAIPFASFSVFRIYFQSTLRITLFNLIAILNSVLLLATTMIAVQSKWGLTFIFAGYVISQILTLIFSAGLTRKYVRFSLKYDYETWKNIVRDGWMIGALNLSVALFARIDQVMLGSMRNSVEVGLYSASVRLSEVFLVIPEIISLIVFPLLSRYYYTSKKLFAMTYRDALKITAWIFVPLPVAVMFVSSVMISTLFGDEYLSAAGALNILIWSQSLATFSLMLSHILIVENNQRYLFLLTIPTVLSNVILNYILIPRYGYIGAGCAKLFCVGFATLNLALFREIRGYLMTAIRMAFRPALATIVLAGYLFLAFPPHERSVKLPVGVCIYTVVLVILNHLRGLRKRTDAAGEE